ncbi:hypothetical protein KAR91_83570, partial [Candidatus Pacearchaeota archaeon]|nr:hypothetical protein [Candidatus Pacearchaeota archaeon]
GGGGGYPGGGGGYPGGYPDGGGYPLPDGGTNPIPLPTPTVPSKQEVNKVRAMQESMPQTQPTTTIQSNNRLSLEERDGVSCLNLRGSQQLWKTFYVKEYGGSGAINFSYHPNDVELLSSLNGGNFQKVNNTKLDGPCGPNPCSQTIDGKSTFTIEHLLDQVGEIKLKLRAYSCSEGGTDCSDWMDSNEITLNIYPQETSLYADLQVSGDAQITEASQTKSYALTAIDFRSDAVTSMNFDLNYLSVIANKGVISNLTKDGHQVRFDYTPNQIGSGTLNIDYQCKDTFYAVTVPQPEAPVQEEPPAEEPITETPVEGTEPENPQQPPVENQIICGNGVVEEGEICDEGEGNNSDSYQSAQHCNASCSGYANYCGDEIVNGSESCDGSVPAANTCTSEIGAGTVGTLFCSSNCTINTSACKTHTITNCPSSILPQDPPNARGNLVITGGGISALDWAVDGSAVAGSGNSLALQDLSIGNHTVVLNEVDECIFAVDPYTYADYLEAKRIANLGGYVPTADELILYDYNLDGSITTEDRIAIYNNLP